MSRVAKSIKITSRDIKKLKSIVGNPENTKEAANRCKAILLAGEGKQNKEIAAALHVRENSVGEWRKAWNDRGIEGILSIARTGRPKGQARIQLESQAGNSETTREKLLELAGKANASRSTLQRAMNAAGARYSESELIDLRMATQPKMLDVMGLYVSSNEAAVILRTAPPGQRLFGGKLYAHSPAVQSLLGEAGASEGDSDASIELGKALELLGKHAGELAYSGPGRTMRHYLASVVPHIPVNGNEQYYVIYSTAKPMNPIASYSRIHYSPASGMERWAEEVRFWMDVLLDDPGYAGKFNASLNAYIGSRLPDAEPFQWCREDMPAKEAAIGGQACDGSLFDDPGVHTVIVGSARIIGRDGEVANVTLTETNVVPPLDGIDFDSVESTGRSLGDVDSGISRFLKKLGGEAVAEVFDAAVKKKEPSGIGKAEAETENGRIAIAVPMAVRNALKPMQRIWSPFLRRITERACIISSYREGTDEINEILHREKDEEKITPANALDIVHQDGALCEECDLEYVGKVFRETPWISDNGIVGDPGKVPEGVRSPKVSEESRELVRKKVDEAASLFNEGRPPAERINRERLCDAFEFHPSDMVFASVDTILVPFQKEHRNVNGETGNNREKKRLGVANGIVTSSEGTFRLTGATEEIVVQKMLAYMIGNNLLENRGLAFFMDGAKSLKKLVEKYFGFREYYYHLDWYHLWKKCYELFSMALYGGKDNKERNNLIRYEFFKRIWAGNIEEAVDYLGTLLESKEKTVKSKPMLNAIIAYVSENKKDDIYSYGARRELGLINSSNAVEKQNDTDVAQYCKECACSWSEDGVLSVAHIALLREQGKDVEWYRSHAVDYSPVPLSETLQARMWMA